MGAPIGPRSGAPFLKGKYVLDKKLGEGGMSQVWSAIEVHSGNPVAIKVLHEQTRSFALRFKQECRVYAKLRHPNIVPMYESGADEDGVLYIVMDLLVAKTLRRILQVQPRLDFRPAAHVGIQLAEACAYMHAKGIWHRDLKPENLMLGTGTEKSQKGHLWVVDFGIAKLARPEDAGLDTGELPDVGTVRYMAPEQCQLARRHEVDGRVDIYAFGVIMYEALTGHHIFIKEGEPTSAAQILVGHITAPVRPLRSLAPGVPEALAVLIERCVAKHPADRPSSFEEIGDTIGEVIQRAARVEDAYAVRHLEERRRSVARQAAFSDVGDTGPTPPRASDHETTTLVRATPGPAAVSPAAQSLVAPTPTPEPAPPPSPPPPVGKGGTTPMTSAAVLFAQRAAAASAPAKGIRGTATMPTAKALREQGKDPARPADPTYAARVQEVVRQSGSLPVRPSPVLADRPPAGMPSTRVEPLAGPREATDRLRRSVLQGVLWGLVVAIVLALAVVLRQRLRGLGGDHVEPPGRPPTSGDAG